MMVSWKDYFQLFLSCAILTECCLAVCPTDWTENAGQCYFSSSARVSWNIARSNCQTMGGDLVSLADATERDYVYNKFIANTGSDYWVGANDISFEGSIVWSDGTVFDNTIPVWKAGQPDNGANTADASVQEDCIEITDEINNAQSQGSWDDTQCDKSRKYICKKSNQDVPDCDEAAGFVKHGSFCYRLVVDEYDWQTAEKDCEDRWNSELVAITSDAEQNVINDMMLTVNKDIWIGLSDISTPGTLRWSNGHDQLLYTNWASGEPTAAVAGGQCTQSTLVANGQWNIADCYAQKPYICRKGLRAVCPTGWIYGHGKCYEIVLNQNFFLSWSQAYKYCTAKNARMLKIQNDDEQHFIASFGTELYKEGVLQLWLGISDIGHDQTLTWSDQSTISYQQWDGAHTPRAGQDDCAQFYLGKAQGNWELLTCYSQQAFVCEVTEGTVLSDVEVPDEIYYQCPKGWRLRPPYCYEFGTETMTWDEAEAYCVTVYGHLASIHDGDEASFVAGHVLVPAWIGANDIVFENNFAYTDGTNFDFHNWQSNEPNGGSSQNCVNMWANERGTWNDDPCVRPYSYVCKANAVQLLNPKPLPTLPPDVNDILCGSDGYIHNPATHKCYRIEQDFSRTWQDARIHCQKEGGDLASVNSPDEQAFIQTYASLASKQIALWIGALDSKSGPINAPTVDLNDGGWRWSDGSPFNYINWNPGEPNNVNDEDCIEMQVYGGRWNDLKCTDFRGYICEKKDPDFYTVAPANDCNGVDCCYRHLGVERGGSIKDRQLTASSQMDSASGPDRGRLNTYDQYIALPSVGPGKGGWIPLQDQQETQWIQVDLEEFYEVRGVITQGLNGISQPVNQNMWSKAISIQYKTHKVQDVWEWVRDPLGNKMIFDANHDQNTQVTNIFQRPVIATGIRIYTESCRLGCALRFEVVGCLPACADSLVVLNDGQYPQLPDTLYMSSSSLSGYGTENSKLDYSETSGASGCWKPTSNDKNQWLQIDLSQPRKLAGILTQGNPESQEWVTEYYIQFSNDGSVFTTYLNTDGSNQLFPANSNQNTISEGFLREPITTRYVRIVPRAWNVAIALRFDIIGCDNDDLVTCKDTAEARPDSFTVDCPAGCDVTAATVYGTQIYAQQSSICAAAVHDGRILGDHGGTVDVKKINGKQSYTGSYAHGVTSQDFGASDRSIVFQGDHLGCSNGWQGWQDWCYYTPRASANLSWADARDYCQRQGGDLASIHSQAEQDFVSTLLFYQYNIRDTWIGMNDLDQLNYYQWSDGSDVTFTAWRPLAPDGQHERCIHMFREGGRWNDKPCQSLENLVCKMDKYPVNQQQTAVDGCETGWIAFEGSCYFIDLTRMVWINSEDYCKGVGGHLAAINTVYEQMFLLSQIAEATHSSDSEKFWIGLGAYINPNSDALDYMWSTGEPVTFTAWAQNQPNIQHTCSFPFLYNGIEYYNCIEEGRPYELVGPWCSADPVYTNHFVACDGWSDSQVGCFRMDSVTGLWSQGQPIACGSDAYKICEKPRVGYTNPPLPTTPSPNGNCPYGWYGSGKSSYCYQINEVPATSRLTWSEADVYCKSQGAELASMHSYQEEQIIASGVQHSSGNDFFWIGLKSVDGGSYGWTDSTPLTYTNWKSSEPNNHNGRENCVEANYPGDSAGWNDMSCDSVQNWICKVLRGTDLLPPVTPPPAQISYECGTDVPWYAYTSTSGNQPRYCYSTFTELTGYYEANQNCKALGGNLVSIHAQDEQAFLTGLTSKIDLASFWIGLIQDGLGGYYIWVDGSPLVYTNWWLGEPNDYNGQESCVQISNLYGLWNDDNCGRKHGYICKKLIGSTPGPVPPTPAVPGGCPDGWSLYGSKCFLLAGFSDTSLRKTWRDAETYCNEQGGFLASIPNQYYNAFLVAQMLYKQTAVWIGLNTIGNNRVFLWSDNEAVTYTNWGSGEPNDVGSEECTEMYGNGRWNDQGCEDTKPFLCNVWRSDAYAEPNPDTTGCPSGYMRWQTGCYRLYSDASDQMSWEDARDKCRADGQQYGLKIELVSIWTTMEDMLVKSMFWPDIDDEYFWIGLYYNHSQTNGETQFIWVDGSAVYYTNWDTNEPQQAQSDMGCIRMRNYGTWSLVDDQACDIKRPFVCKYEEYEFPTQTPGLGLCDPDWIAFGDYCYFVRPDNPLVSWGDAEAACNSRGGFLTSVHSDLENKAIMSWNDGHTVWMGLKRNAWGGFAWSDSSPVDFTNWNAGQPDNYGETGEPCSEMGKDGTWNDVVCSYSRGYVCKKHKSYASCAFPSSERTDCGYEGISEYECLERLCCWDTSNSASSNCYYSRDDAQCLEKGGQCKDYMYNTCELGYEQNLCSGGDGNRCCFTCDADDDTCNEQVDGWEDGDDACENDPTISGTCQYNSNYCSGTYLSGKCGGPAQRQCCSGNYVPPTDPPRTTKTPSTDKTVTVTPITETTKQTTGFARTEEIPAAGSGLSGGAIAGIVITIVFLLAGAGLAFFYHRTGQFPTPTHLASSFTRKEASPVGGYDNPISYVKETEDDGEVEFGSSNA